MEQQVAAKHQCCTFTVRNKRRNLFFANLRYIFFSSVGVGAHSKCALKKPTGRRRLICTLLYPLSIFSLCFSKPLLFRSTEASLRCDFDTFTDRWTLDLPLSSLTLSRASPLPPLLPQPTLPPPPLYFFPFAFCPSPLSLGSQSSCTRHVCQFGWSGSRRCGDAETGGSRREGAMEGRRDRCTRREIVAERWRDIWCSLAGAAMSVVTICKHTHQHTHIDTSTVGKWTQGKSVPSQTEKINTTGNWFLLSVQMWQYISW